MQSSSNKHILEIDSVELSFGERVILSNVYLRVETGKVTSLLGRNGCGKSCLMRILFDELKPTYKSTRIDSVWHEHLSCTQVMYLPQNSCIPKYMKVKNVFKDYGVSFDNFISLFPEFSSLAENKICELSGGESRIIEVYTILYSNTQFVMLDEPFSQIMPVHIERIKALIEDQKANKGILITDHMYRHILGITDYLYILSNQSVYLTKCNEDLIEYGYLNRID